MPRGELFLEVRCEEIPARMLPPAIEQLGTRLFEELVPRGLTPRVVETGFTPRRLVLTLKGLKSREPDRREEMVGPPASVAFDEQGAPTAAALGFAKRCRVEAKDLKRIQTPKGEYLAVEQTNPGRSTVEVLSELVPRIISSLTWPKSMRWGEGEGPWIRPIHGIVALFEDQVVPFELFGVAAGDRSVGHPILSPRPFQVRGSSDYRRKISRRGIEVRFEKRRQRILEDATRSASELGGNLVEDAELLDKLAAICEIPGLIGGQFDSRFLDLPREVLIASLRDHQSALSVEAEGELLPHFLTVMDRQDDPEGRIRAGNEWVVEARLADARFFYDEDRKAPLAERGERLEHLTFHLRLGSYAEKTERIAKLVEILCEELDWPEELPAAGRAARLLKSDLTTEMVKEFTSLQGVMGGVYSREQGEPEAVWQAVYDQYLPTSTNDPIPRSRVGMVTGLADRIDSLVGMFGLNLIPTGSRDPFGLRRAAQGVARILLEGELDLDLDLAAARAARLYGETLELSGDEVLAALRPFFQDRLRHLLGMQGYAYDEIEAALAAGSSNLPDLRRRVDALHRTRQEPGFLDVVLAAKRIANILKDSPEHRLDEGLLKEAAERELFTASRRLREELAEAEEAADYEEGLRRIARFADVLERFFVEVLVMDENQDLRRNRIALLQSIQRVLSRTARLTEMVVDRAEHRGRAAELNQEETENS